MVDTKAMVFLLEHLHEFEDGGESVKTIGIYSSREAALQAVERLKLQPGFRDAPGGFSIDCYTVDMDHWEEGYLSTGRTGQSPEPKGRPKRRKESGGEGKRREGSRRDSVK